MNPELSDIIALEIKKELAERYFGFRKLVEEDKLDFSEKVDQYAFILEKRISFDLLRIYSLLGNENHIHAFLRIIGLPEEEWPRYYHSVFTDEEMIRRRVFKGIRTRGLTKKRRFTHLLIDCYENLCDNAVRYQDKFAQLIEKAALINEEIRLFHRQNDLGTILGFLRSLGDASTYGSMQGGLESGIASSLEKKMAIPLLDPVERYLPRFPALPPLDTIRGDLKRLAARAYATHSPEDRLFFTSKKEPADRILD